MPGSSSEQPPSIGNLTDIVHGPQPNNSELPEEMFLDGMKLLASAIDRKDTRAIEDSEQRMAQLLDAHPELRKHFEIED